MSNQAESRRIFDEDEEKQISETPMNTSMQSEPDINNNNNNNNNYNNNHYEKPPPPAFSQNFTFYPPAQQQEPLHEYSSHSVIPSPNKSFSVQSIQSSPSPQSMTIPIRSTQSIQQKSKSQPTSSSSSNKINHPIVKQLVDMGFPENYVQRACKIFKKNFGSKPFRLEVLTEIILRLQMKDRESSPSHSKNKKNGSSNKSLELLLSKSKQDDIGRDGDKEHDDIISIMNEQQRPSLKQSGTSLVADDHHHRNHSNHSYDSSLNLNNLNYEESISYDHNNKNGLILIEVIMPWSLSGLQRCEIHIRCDQTLYDLKHLISTNLNNFDSSNDEYVFYHNDTGFIFNNNNITIKQCMIYIDGKNNNLSLKIGRFKGDNRSSKKLPPPPSKKRSSTKLKPLPPTKKNNNNNLNIQSSDFDSIRQRRKSTKLDVIKSKIAIETNKNFKEIMTYIKDSPFWWKKMNDGIGRVRKLTMRLKSIATLISELCNLLKKFSSHCNKLSIDVMKSWEDIENEFCGDVLSLNAQFFNLGDTINTLSTASMMLSHTLEKVIVDEFNEFSDYHLNHLLLSNRELITMKHEYEEYLQSILHNKAQNGENSDILRKNKCESLRKQYELKRYDHCIILNNIINRHRYDIILNLCAAFCGFETFFHIGYEASLSHKQFHHSIRIGLSEKDKKQKLYFDRIVNKNRKILVNVLNQGKDYNDYKQKIKPIYIVENKSNDNDYHYDDDDLIDSKQRQRFKHVSLDYYDGYLWKQSSKSFKKWQKRWFVLTNGELEYFRNSEKASSKSSNKLNNKMNKFSKINVINKQKSIGSKSGNKEYIGNTALCKVKKAIDHDYKFVFEIITPTRRIYALQAQTANEYDEWFYVLSNQCARLLLRKNTIDRFKKHNKMKNNISYSISDQNNTIKQEKDSLKNRIFLLNKYCADCGRLSPEWCSINIGVIICVNCCGVHRGLGTHISKMRSLKLDDLSIITLKSIKKLGGNEKLNKKLLECNLNIFENEDSKMYKKINYEKCTQIERSNFIKNKYTFKMFINHENIDNDNNNNIDYNQNLWNAVCNNDFFGVIYALYHGADINHQFIKYHNKTVLHEAAERNYTEMVELLVNNEAQANIEDGNEEKPNQIAIKQSLNGIDNTEIQNILKTAIY